MTPEELRRYINIALEKIEEDGADPEESFVAVADYLAEQHVDLSKKQAIIDKLNEVLGLCYKVHELQNLKYAVLRLAQQRVCLAADT